MNAPSRGFTLCNIATALLFVLECFLAELSMAAVEMSCDQCGIHKLVVPGFLEFANAYRYLFLIIPAFGIAGMIYAWPGKWLNDTQIAHLNMIRLTACLLCFVAAMVMALLPVIKIFTFIGAAPEA